MISFEQFYHPISINSILHSYRRSCNSWSDAVESHKAAIFKSGIELFRLRAENQYIKAFCFNNYENFQNQMVILTNQKFINLDVRQQLDNSKLFSEISAQPDSSHALIEGQAQSTPS